MAGTTCFVCKKNVTRTKKAVTCCVCSKLFHVSCSDIDELQLDGIAKGTVEWKCTNCRTKSTRRSIITGGNTVIMKSTPASFKTTMTTKPSTSTESQDSSTSAIEATLSELNNKIKTLQQGFSVASTAIDDIKGHLTSLNNLSSKVKENSKTLLLCSSKK